MEIYIYEKSIQKLVNITALCEMCHLNIHLGFAFESLSNEELNKLRDHWCRVNSESYENFKIYARKVITLCDLRDEINWQIDFLFKKEKQAPV